VRLLAAEGLTAGKIDLAHTFYDFTRREPFATLVGAAHVVEPCFPELPDGRPRKFVVLGIGRTRQALVDEMRDGNLALVLGEWREQLVDWISLARSCTSSRYLDRGSAKS